MTASPATLTVVNQSQHYAAIQVPDEYQYTGGADSTAILQLMEQMRSEGFEPALFIPMSGLIYCRKIPIDRGGA